ncbi:hypothetical protein DYBT9275_05641 [Dyadobacter sp. CECT 9275]|uniref:Uncharacterized protein n=1 Tax=Dyadobacter helix TaxID=2822344 RepID=A0A916JK94_9BACT|nr:hypothetical protein [Dyadobacter sp. CECT 9275]CAG5016809.1 hypothetical protein DYBT9275_05641 [Dyadobacter sp. CECT 9275]
MMTIQLIKGEFSASDALGIITNLIQTKIKYHEQKISSDMSEEDIKFREKKIKKLQEDLSEVKKHIAGIPGNVALASHVNIE